MVIPNVGSNFDALAWFHDLVPGYSFDHCVSSMHIVLYFSHALHSNLSLKSYSVAMALRSCHKAVLLALAIVLSFWLSFAFGSKQVQFNDWHYDYRVLSYGLNRPDKHDDLGKIPPKFISSRGWPEHRLRIQEEMAYR